jgi:hypothetical protein
VEENERLLEVVSFSGAELKRLKEENAYLLTTSLAKCF